MPLLPRPSDVVSVHKAADELEAEIIRGLLEQAGIDAMVRCRQVPGYGVPEWPGIWGEVLVRPADEDAAKQVIAEYLEAVRTAPQEPEPS
ncbi:MAG: DUF2007 domain-containing protein [Armatimonadota bacterium]|nr:DUF2007 domain-containing protein [Armatimonadota bacterium]